MNLTARSEGGEIGECGRGKLDGADTEVVLTAEEVGELGEATAATLHFQVFCGLITLL